MQAVKWSLEALVLVFSVLLLVELQVPPPTPVSLLVTENIFLVFFALEVCGDFYAAND